MQGAQPQRERNERVPLNVEKGIRGEKVKIEEILCKVVLVRDIKGHFRIKSCRKGHLEIAGELREARLRRKGLLEPPQHQEVERAI